MAEKRRSLALDLAPLIALLGVWLLAGLVSAATVARAEGTFRHLALGVVTMPVLVMIGRAAWRLRSKPAR